MFKKLRSRTVDVICSHVPVGVAERDRVYRRQLILVLLMIFSVSRVVFFICDDVGFQPAPGSPTSPMNEEVRGHRKVGFLQHGGQLESFKPSVCPHVRSILLRLRPFRRLRNTLFTLETTLAAELQDINLGIRGRSTGGQLGSL